MIKLELILKHAAAQPDNVAVCDGARTILWAGFAHETRCLAHGINAKLQPDSIRRAAFLSSDRVELAIAMAACATLGIPVTGLDHHLEPDVLAACMAATEVDLVFVSSSDAPAIMDIVAASGHAPLIVDMDDLVGTGFSALTDNNPAKGDATGFQPLPRALKAISFTSGTSALPKAVIRTTSFEQRRFAYFTQRYGFSDADRHLSAIPLYHAAGNGWSRLFLTLGGMVRLVGKAEPATLAQIIFNEAITSSVMPPALITAVVRHVENKKQHAQDVSQIFDRPETANPVMRFLLTGGKHFPVPDKLAAMDLFPGALNEYYGTTETGVNTIADSAMLAVCPASCGEAFEGNHIIILDELAQPVAQGQTGRVAISSYMNMDGYHGVPHHQMMHNGMNFIVTADNGYLENGRLHLVNRRSELANFNQYGLENDLLQLPCLMQAAIILHEQDNALKTDLALVLHEGRALGPVLLSNIHKIADKHGADLRLIREVSLIPHSKTGKVQSAQLARLMS